MSKDKDFKRLVRARMLKTGQSYSAAKSSLVTQRDRLRERAVAALPGADPRRRAELELSRLLEHLRDAVDGAIAAGLNWQDIGSKLGLDPELLQVWLHD